MAKDDIFDFITLSNMQIKLRVDPQPDFSMAEFACLVDINTEVFKGEIETVYFGDDLLDFKNALESLDVPGKVKLGGNRCAEVVFDIQKQIGGPEGSLAIEVSATANGSDPWPKLLFLEFSVPPEFPKATISKVDQFMAHNNLN